MDLIILNTAFTVFKGLLLKSISAAVVGGSKTGDMLSQFFLIIFMVLLVAAAAYFSIRFVGRRGGAARGRGANLKMIEAVSVGMQANLQIVRVGARYFLIGVTKDRISLISELDENDLSLAEPSQKVIPFENYFAKYIRKRPDKEQ